MVSHTASTHLMSKINSIENFNNQLQRQATFITLLTIDALTVCWWS